MLSSSRSRIAGLIGNLLGHYDSALFGLAAPFLAPLFFEGKDPITDLILTYCMMPLGLLTKPLGSLFFGWIGDRFGRRQSLFYSLLGIAIVTMAIGALPTYQKVGPLAPCFLALCRMLQSFFSAGESIGGALFLLERTEKKERSLISSFYDTSSVAGLLIASLAIEATLCFGDILEHWRILFLAGGVTAIIGVFLRKEDAKEKESPLAKNSRSHSILSVLAANKIPILIILITSGFTHVTYQLAFMFMNGFVPLVSSFLAIETLSANTKLLVLDMLLLPFFGILSYRFGKEKIMAIGSFLSFALAIPLFFLIPTASLKMIYTIRICIVLFGISFAAPYYAWAIDQVPPKNRYLVLALGSSLGSQLIGAPTSAICLWLYQVTQLHFAPGIYLALIAGVTSLVVYRLQKKQSFANLRPG